MKFVRGFDGNVCLQQPAFCVKSKRRRVQESSLWDFEVWVWFTDRELSGRCDCIVARWQSGSGICSVGDSRPSDDPKCVTWESPRAAREPK